MQLSGPACDTKVTVTSQNIQIYGKPALKSSRIRALWKAGGVAKSTGQMKLLKRQEKSVPSKGARSVAKNPNQDLVTRNKRKTFQNYLKFNAWKQRNQTRRGT